MKIEEEYISLNKLDDQMMLTSDQDLEGEIITRRLIQDSIWKNLHLKESILKQKSRIRWMKEGDNNTKFFHAIMKARYRRNSIISVKNGDGVVIKVVSKVKGAIQNYFAARLCRTIVPRPYLKNISLEQLLNIKSWSLEDAFTAEEIKNVVFNGDEDKSPGPDGFNLEFMKNC